MARKKLTKEQVTLLLPRTHDMCAMHDVAPTCENYRLVQGDHFFGEFAHIRAAEEGGQRWDGNMDDTQRNDIANILVLCPNHHTIIDKKDNGYTAERLHEIKAQHENQNSLPPLEASAAAVDDAVAVANINVTNTNINSGDGIQQVSTMSSTAPQANYSAARDVYIFNGAAPSPTAVISAQSAVGFLQPDRTFTMTVQTIWLNMSDGHSAAGSSFEAEYLVFSVGDKQFAVLAQELAERTANIGRDSTGKYDMEIATMILVLEHARLASSGGLEGHTLLQEFQNLSQETSVRLVIETNHEAVRLIPFEKLDEVSVRCANPIKLMFRGVL